MVQLQIKLSMLVNSLESLSGGIVGLNDVININRRASIDEIMDFFMMVEVYGSQSPTNE